MSSVAPPEAVRTAAQPWTRTFYWSLRRELWEHRAVYLAPLATAAFAAFVHFMSALFISDAERTSALAKPAAAGAFMSLYDAVSGVIVVSGLLVGGLYCVGALHSERRDRSILFWKSLPVSDLTTVLAKAAVPTVVLPATLFAAVVGANLVMITLQSIAWQAGGYDAGELWARLDLPFLWLTLLYGLPFMVLWYAPLHAWLLLVSAWAPRWPFLWGATPFVAALIVEHLALHHTRAHWMVERYLAGGVLQPYTVDGRGAEWIKRLGDLEPLRLYTLPSLWIGLLLAALFLAGAVRLRRSRGPI